MANGPWKEPDDADAAHPGDVRPETESERIRILTVGYDAEELMPVVDALRNAV
jgi:hypothetical protein